MTIFNVPTKEEVSTTISLVGDKTISNCINNTSRVPVDFPVVTPLQSESA